MTKEIDPRKQKICCCPEMFISSVVGLKCIVKDNLNNAENDNFVSVFSEKHQLNQIIGFSLYSIAQLRLAANPNYYGDRNLIFLL